MDLTWYMQNPLVMQFVASSAYVLFMGFCFCDGFKLHISRKVAWFLVFMVVAISVFQQKGEFDLNLILPVPTLLAILLCVNEVRNRTGKAT